MNKIEEVSANEERYRRIFGNDSDNTIKEPVSENTYFTMGVVPAETYGSISTTPRKEQY